MALEVPCPNCQTTLRAPNDAGGRKARCKKCGHGFRLPGDNVGPTVGEETTQLSAVDQPGLNFDGSPGDDSLAAEPVSRHAGHKSSVSRSARRGDQSNTGTILTILGIVAVLGAGIAAIVFASGQDKQKEQAAASSTPAPKEKPHEPVKDKDAAKKKDADKASSKGPPSEAKGTTSKAPDRKPNVVVTGGFKFPPPVVTAEKFTAPAVKGVADVKYSDVRKLYVSGGDAPVAAILSVGSAGFQGKGAKDYLDRYNLSSGLRIDRTEIEAGAPWPRVGDLSPNGDLFIGESPAGTLTVYDLAGKQKAGTPFKPCDGVPLVAAFFLDSKTVFVAAKDGRLETWSAKEGQKMKGGAVGSGLTAKSLALNPDRSKVVAVAGGSLHEISSATLEAKAVLPLPGAAEALAVALGAAGDRVAVAYRTAAPGVQTKLAIARLGDPKPTGEFLLDAAAGMPETLEWSGPELLTLATTHQSAALVIETETNLPLAVLWPKGGAAKHVLASGKHFAVMPDADAKACLLLGVNFPPDELLTLQAEAAEAKAPVGFVLAVEGVGR